MQSYHHIAMLVKSEISQALLSGYSNSVDMWLDLY